MLNVQAQRIATGGCCNVSIQARGCARLYCSSVLKNQAQNLSMNTYDSCLHCVEDEGFVYTTVYPNQSYNAIASRHLGTGTLSASLLAYMICMYDTSHLVRYEYIYHVHCLKLHQRPVAQQPCPQHLCTLTNNKKYAHVRVYLRCL